MGLKNSYQDREILDDEQLDRRHQDNSMFLKILELIICILALPAFIIGVLQYYGLFKKGRLRFSVILFISVIEILLILPFALNTSLMTSISYLFHGNFVYFIQSITLWDLILGIIVSDSLIIFKALQFKFNPATLSMNGWSKFRYRDTPLIYFKKKFLQKELSEGKCYSDTDSPIGLLSESPKFRKPEIDENEEALKKYNPAVVYRSYHDAVHHTIITGQTGSGKSICMLSLMYNDILNKIPLCVVDFKKSGDELYFLSKWAKEHGRDFYYFTNGEGSKNDFYGEQATYDPLSTGDQTSRADFILSLREWDAASDVYKQRTTEILQGVLFALIQVPREEATNIDWDSGNLKKLLSALSMENMYDLVNYLSKELEKGQYNVTEQLRVSNFIDNYKELSNPKSQTGKALREQLSGIRTVINKLVMSSYGKWLMKGSSSKHIDLLKFATSDKAPIVLFAFSAQEEPDFAKSMGQVIMSDLKRASSAKTEMNDNRLFGVYVDEFQTLNPKSIADLLAKARSAGFFITIASQSLEQISAAASENADATLQSILDVCGNYLFLKGAKQDSAERMAKIMGQNRHVIRQVQNRLNSGFLQLNIFNNRHAIVSTNVQDDWIVSPSDFQSLRDSRETNGKYSEAYFISSSDDHKNKAILNSAQKVQIIAQKDLLPGASKEFKDFISNQTFNQLSRLNDSKVIKVKESDPFEDVEKLHNFDEPDLEVKESNNNMNQSKEKEPKKIASEQVLDTVNKHHEFNKTQVPSREKAKPMPMTTFERIQAVKNDKSRHDTKLEGQDDPEALSHNVEPIPKDSSGSEKDKGKFKLPEL